MSGLTDTVRPLLLERLEGKAWVGGEAAGLLGIQSTRSLSLEDWQAMDLSPWVLTAHRGNGRIYVGIGKPTLTHTVRDHARAWYWTEVGTGSRERLTEVRRHFTDYLMAQGLPATGKARDEGKRVMALYHRRYRAGGFSGFHNVALQWDAGTKVEQVAASESTDLEVAQALKALVIQGYVSPKSADLAYCRLTDTPLALCRGCGRVTSNRTTRLHKGCQPPTRHIDAVPTITYQGGGLDGPDDT